MGGRARNIHLTYRQWETARARDVKFVDKTGDPPTDWLCRAKDVLVFKL
jgi:hypothetical protein